MRHVFLFLIFGTAICAAQADPAADLKRYDNECKGCAKILISRLDTRNQKLYDNERTESQAEWLKRDSKLVKDGKLKPALWFTPFRSNAEYNVVWTLQMQSLQDPAAMDAWVWVYEVASGRKLFQTWHRSIYWQTDHPEQQCLVEALKFLRTRKATPDGFKFATIEDNREYFPSPGEDHH